VVFNNNELFPLRTDVNFNNVQYEIHQVQKYPLIDAEISCIKQFPLDYMHLVCLGVVKCNLCYLKQGPKDCKLSYRQINQISEKALVVKWNNAY